MSDDEQTFRFAKSVDGAPSQHIDDPRLALAAMCVAMQQGAGFKDYIDLRQSNCPYCKGAGFNTGWGVWRFVCGAEYHADDEGTCATPCPVAPPC